MEYIWNADTPKHLQVISWQNIPFHLYFPNTTYLNNEVIDRPKVAGTVLQKVVEIIHSITKSSSSYTNYTNYINIRKLLWAFKLNRRYGPLCGPKSSFCRGLQPLPAAYFCPWNIKILYMLFRPINSIFGVQ